MRILPTATFYSEATYVKTTEEADMWIAGFSTKSKTAWTVLLLVKALLIASTEVPDRQKDVNFKDLRS